MKKHLLLISAYFVLFQTLAQPPIAFPSEYIDFAIDSNYFTINGIYTFVNKTDKPQSSNIFFPFGIETREIDSIRVFNLNQLMPVNFIKQKKGISFGLFLLAGDTTEINIFYRQPADTMNSYILTTTKSWGAALQIAKYSLTVPFGLPVGSLSYPPDSVTTRDNNRVFYWNKTNFLPEKDFEVELKF